MGWALGCGNRERQKDLGGGTDTGSTGLGDWQEGEAGARRQAWGAVGRLEGAHTQSAGCEVLWRVRWAQGCVGGGSGEVQWLTWASDYPWLGSPEQAWWPGVVAVVVAGPAGLLCHGLASQPAQAQPGADSLRPRPQSAS